MKQYTLPSIPVVNTLEDRPDRHNDYTIRQLQEHVERQERYIRRLQSELQQLRTLVESRLYK